MALTQNEAMQLLSLADEPLLLQCEVNHYRSTGPGGQHRNKTSSAVRIKHVPTELVGIAEEDRSQHVNKKRALRRLRLTMALALSSSCEIEHFEPSEHLMSFVHRNRVNLSLRTVEGLQALFELLVLLRGANGQVGDVARSLNISTSALVKAFEKDKAIWKHVDQLRRQFDLKPLRRS